MKKLTDQEVDSIFKAAEEGFQPPFDPAAWDAMSTRLNEPRKAKWKTILPLALLGIVIFSTGVWVGTGFHQSPESASLQTIASHQPITHEPEIVSDKNETSRDFVDDTPGMKKSHQGGAAKPRSSQRLQPSIPTSFSLNHKDMGNRFTAEVSADDSNQFPANAENELQEHEKTASGHASPGAISADSINNFVMAQPSDSTLQGGQKEETEKKESRSSRSLFIRALASPDFSSIPHASSSPVGSNYAVVLEYYFSDRWSVATGAIWSDKKYASNHEIQYSGYNADQLEGDCNILDIPLNIYYRFPTLSRTSFYVGAGFSSYIMLKEAYTYTVSTGYGDRYYSTSVDGKNNEWFKILNLSLGVQHRLSDRWSLQAEPFVKAPLAGIGEQGVKLSSLGIFFGLKYKIN